MRSRSIQSLRELILRDFQQCRQKTLDLLDEINPDYFNRQAHKNFSPIGWHFGHIAFTEAYWILEYLAQQNPYFPQYHRLFAADGLPKAERENLPAIADIVEYLAIIREAVGDYLAVAPIAQQERLWRWLLQHESQHNETIAIVWQLHRRQRNYTEGARNFAPARDIPSFANCWEGKKPSYEDMVNIEAGEFVLGSNTINAQDNERPQHKIYLDTYWIDRYPVTCGQYREFMSAGGYQNSAYWSEAGWHWLQNNPVSQPLYWSDAPEWEEHPVCGTNYYEAQAYANFVGKRLPSEAEWEKAAQRKHNFKYKCNHDNAIGHTTPVNAYPESKSNYGCYDMLGNVWEWTNSLFAQYPGFTSYPYVGYSQIYFDRQHYVLRGGSWATRPWGLRSTFRNWYHPWVRQIFAGFRCAL